MERRTAVIVIGVVVTGVVMLLGGLVIGVAAFVVFGSPGDDIVRTFESAHYDTVADWPGAANTEERFELDLPESSRDIWLASDGFQDPYYHLRITIDPADVGALEDSPGCGGLLPQAESEPVDAFTTEEIDWWTPGTATAYQQCQGVETTERHQHVFIDQSDPAAYDVYIQVTYF